MENSNQKIDEFVHELRLLWSAEKMLLDAMPEMIAMSHDQGLKNILSHHFAETDQHKIAIQGICKQLGVDYFGETNAQLQQILIEGRNALSGKSPGDSTDLALIDSATNIEKFEITAYKSAAEHAKMLGFEGLSSRLALTLEEEIEAKTKLNFLFKNVSNPGIKSMEENL